LPPSVAVVFCGVGGLRPKTPKMSRKHHFWGCKWRFLADFVVLAVFFIKSEKNVAFLVKI
jgi:hypothetical protein